MAPLPKAVFLLFLNHPEGIKFKCLADYRTELLSIYQNIKARDVYNPLDEKSIDCLTDPLNNSINEKCARIREAFISEIDERLGRSYYVVGRRGESKKIILSRDLVIWE